MSRRWRALPSCWRRRAVRCRSRGSRCARTGWRTPPTPCRTCRRIAGAASVATRRSSRATSPSRRWPPCPRCWLIAMTANASSRCSTSWRPTGASSMRIPPASRPRCSSACAPCSVRPRRRRAVLRPGASLRPRRRPRRAARPGPADRHLARRRLPLATHEGKSMESKHEKYQQLIDHCRTLPPTPTAVAHPCDRSSLEGALQAAKLGLIAPVLVGPRARIESTAQSCELDISALPIVDAPYSEAAAAKAVELVREGKAEALMKGSLHTDELMGAVVRKDTGLRTARRVSHCFVMDVPGHEQALIIADAAVNIAPTLEEKADILQNAIDLAHALGI